MTREHAAIELAIGEIRRHTTKTCELRDATIFSYDVFLPPTGHTNDGIDLVVFGMNEAEYDCDRELRRIEGKVLEDHSMASFRLKSDPLARESLKKAHNWYGKIRRIVGSDTTAILGEIFFWSSKNLHQDFQSKYDASFDAQPHHPFCREKNEILLNHYDPSLVVVGTSDKRRVSLIAHRYGLTDDKRPTSVGTTELQYFNDQSQRPWLFVPHFSGFRLKAPDKQFIVGVVSTELAAAKRRRNRN